MDMTKKELKALGWDWAFTFVESVLEDISDGYLVCMTYKNSTSCRVVATSWTRETSLAKESIYRLWIAGFHQEYMNDD